jgi:hypothetical protein
MNGETEVSDRSDKHPIVWFRAALAAFLATVAVHVVRTAAVVHGHTATHALEGSEVVTAVVAIASILRWAVVRERSRATQEN